MFILRSLPLWCILALSLSLVTAAAADEFPEPSNSEPAPGEPVAAEVAAAALAVPEGFEVTVFASEPAVRNPIAVSWDARGRMWIAENYTYAERELRFDLSLRDRIVVFDDADGDGVADSRTIFTDALQRLTSLEVGLGGVWVMCPPQLLFIPDRDRDAVPDGPAQVVLDGFEVPAENYHNFANGLRFGPDGWLYGRCGASAPGEVGVPGTAAADRVPLRGTMWRYDPRSQVFEALSHGTTNPWGHDWNAFGELFFVNTVNGHLWHGITGAHYVRPHTIDPNPHAYQSIDMHADHWHFDTSGAWHDSRDGAANAYGGGHAHSGTIIYLGDNWPAEYRGRLLTLNFHGRRVNQERLERSGSGYIARHEEDILLSADPFFRGIELTYGPDGGVFVLDWSDTGECHESTGVHRHSGRIFKITHGTPSPPAVRDLTALPVSALVDLLDHPNQWFVRQARLELRWRHESREEDTRGIRDQLAEAGTSFDADRFVAAGESVIGRLERLWTLHAIGLTDREGLLKLLEDEHEHVRLWAIRLLTDRLPLDDVFSRRRDTRGSLRTAAALAPALRELAHRDPSPLVHLGIASALQRLPVEHRGEIAAGLVSHGDNADDANLPLMVWYGLIPVAESDPAALVRIAAVSQWPVTRQFIARRLSEEIESNPQPISDLLARSATADDRFAHDVLAGMSQALEGWRQAPQPASWPEFVASLEGRDDASLAQRATGLSVLFGDGLAMDQVRSWVTDHEAPLAVRRRALQTLIESRPPDLREICEQVLGERFLNTTAVRGLAQFDDPAIATKLIANYRRFHPSERGSVIDTLVSRVASAQSVLEAIAAGKIPHDAVTPFHARQIRSLGDPELTQRLGQVWGSVRESHGSQQKAIAALKSRLTRDVLADADLANGRAVFAKNCSNCHRLYGIGGETGPDLTGSGRSNLDYLLQNILDPSAVVTADYRASVLLMKDGRVLNGVIAERSERTLRLQTLNTLETLAVEDVEAIEGTDASLMPDGLLQLLSDEQIRDLFAYLQHPTQVPLGE